MFMFDTSTEVDDRR